VQPPHLKRFYKENFMVSELAGTLTKHKIDTEALREEFYKPSSKPVPVKFGTSGHRGVLGAGFCASHARAIAQAVARIHLEGNIKGAILVGGDTRLMSRDTAKICAEVLTGNGLSVKEIIAAAEEVTGKKVNFEVAPRRAGDPPRLIACSDLARKSLNWQPKHESAHDIIETAWKWHLKFPDGYAK
jgi:nucleoside-diphosphate-sugar epimerase